MEQRCCTWTGVPLGLLTPCKGQLQNFPIMFCFMFSWLNKAKYRCVIEKQAFKAKLGNVDNIFLLKEREVIQYCLGSPFPLHEAGLNFLEVSSHTGVPNPLFPLLAREGSLFAKLLNSACFHLFSSFSTLVVSYQGIVPWSRFHFRSLQRLLKPYTCNIKQRINFQPPFKPKSGKT